MPPSLPRALEPAVISPIAALLFMSGCDPSFDQDSIEPRTGGYLTADLDPIPGGGACEECITEAVFTDLGYDTYKLDLAIDGQIRYVGTTSSLADDILLRDLIGAITSPQGKAWSLVRREGDAEITLCSAQQSDKCVFEAHVTPQQNTVRLSILYTTNHEAPAPELLRFVPPDAPLGPGPSSPTMKIRIQHGAVVAKEATIAPASEASSPGLANLDSHDALGFATAHITSRSAYGGVLSCSGILVANDWVLTARHCLPDAPGAQWSLQSDFVPTRVQLVNRARALDPSAFSIAEAKRHPDPARDIALLRLTTAASPILFQPLSLAAFSPHQKACSMHGLGFGRSEKFSGFDWGKQKSIPVQPLSPMAALYGEFAPGVRDKLLLLKNLYVDSHELCRGDSGGPIVHKCKGQPPSVIGIASARVFKSPVGPGLDGLDTEPLMNAFAFSYGNSCGEGELVAYAATLIDADIRDWVAESIGTFIPPQPVPADQ